MKKNIVKIFIITITIIFIPCFVIKTNDKQDAVQSDSKLIYNADNKNNEQAGITTFVSNTSFKKTYYINAERVNVYS